MAVYRCMNHPDERSVSQCSRCGKPVCERCYDPETGHCRTRCGEMGYNSSGSEQPKNLFWTFVVSILAILGGLTLLLMAICGAMIFS